jgi:hypothetical protein
MEMSDEQPAHERAVRRWQLRGAEEVRGGRGQFVSRLDFRHVSSHLHQKKPGYYLMLLRNEIRHRSLRDKLDLMH